MNSLIVMCGIPGSGKSFFAEEYKNAHDNYFVVSTDSIRKEKLGDESDQRDGWDIFMTAYERMTELLQAGHNVIFDATNIHRKSRRKIIKYFKKVFGDAVRLVCIYMTTPLSVCLRRNTNREWRVPESVIRNMYMDFSTPDKEEGWDEVLMNAVTVY